MAKKKKEKEISLAGYIPAGYSPSVDTNQIRVIPPYDDAGVSYKGYSKTQRGDGSYELNPQIPRIQDCFIVGAVTTTGTGTRLDPNKTFYVSAVTVEFKCSNAQIFGQVYDGSSAAAPLQVLFVMPIGAGTYTYDFSNSPRPFKAKDIFFQISAGLAGANDFLHVNLIGWAE